MCILGNWPYLDQVFWPDRKFDWKVIQVEAGDNSPSEKNGEFFRFSDNSIRIPEIQNLRS